MKKIEIKEILRERTKSPHLSTVNKAKTTDDGAVDSMYDNITNLLSNDIFNHAAIVRQLKHEPWGGNSEATNRSLFRKKLNKMNNDEGGEYKFSDETVASIQKVLMGVSSTITHKLGHEGKG